MRFKENSRRGNVVIKQVIGKSLLKTFFVFSKLSWLKCWKRKHRGTEKTNQVLKIDNKFFKAMFNTQFKKILITFAGIFELYFGEVKILESILVTSWLEWLALFSASEDDPDIISENCIGEYSGVTRTLYFERCGKVVWPGERPPKDRTITR